MNDKAQGGNIEIVAKPLPTRWTTTTHEDSDGRVILERTPLGLAPRGFARFLGRGVINMEQQDQHGRVVGIQPLPVTFEIQAETIQEAFERVEIEWNRQHAGIVAKVQDELRKQQLAQVPPSATWSPPPGARRR